MSKSNIAEVEKIIEAKYSNLSRFLRPERFDVQPDTSTADAEWTHWRYTFLNFLSEDGLSMTPDSTKLKLLIHHLSPTLFAYIKDCKSCEEAINTLDKIYLKPKNEILARHKLNTRRQGSTESISDYLRALKLLAHDCGYQSVSAQQHEEQSIRTAFIVGISSQKLRERLLESINLSLEETVKQAVSLEAAEQSSLMMSQSSASSPIHSNAISEGTKEDDSNNLAAVLSSKYRKRCFFCGGSVHSRIRCPANNSVCHKCSKPGHFANVCRSSREQLKQSKYVTNATEISTPSQLGAAYVLAASPASLRKATVSVIINGIRADALIDTGSSVTFINKNFAFLLSLKKIPCKQAISLASLSQVSFVEGMCYASIQIGDHKYKMRSLLVVNNLCADLIIGHDILNEHKTLVFNFGGQKAPLELCNVMEANVPPASLFTNLSPNIQPVAIKSRRHNINDIKFISDEVEKLLADGAIEPSISPWRAQVLVAGGGMHRKRLVIDYSRTINRFTQLDAYPLPNICSIISNVAKYKVFSQIDLKSAYHQVPILEKDKIYTAFEACGKLFQFTRIPFGVTNGVAAFQRTLEYIITEEHLKGTYAYLDDVTVCGMNKCDHDENLNKFMDAVTKYKLTLNIEKCKLAQSSISLLGYTISDNTIKPDMDRLKPLIELPLPTNTQEMKRTLGLFAHYAKWISNFSTKIRPLTETVLFPITNEAKTSFENLKSEIQKSSLTAIDDQEIFTVETDASEFALAATLSQKGRPVAFFSRTLTDSERRQSSIEKEAGAIVESVRKWRHFLIGRHFNLITDQRSVAFMFNSNHSSKIKNEKIERWRLELSCFKFDILYRPGAENIVADALSRVCAHMNIDKLRELHNDLCHPGIVRMIHWIRAKNLPYSVEEVKAMTASCRVCAEIKPRFCQSKGQLIKAIAPFERLNIDFKGPLPGSHKYLLTIIDEYSRFPFAYACKDMSSASVIKCLQDLFCIFGTPLYLHSDRGTAFMSVELSEFLKPLGVATSRTTPYNPCGNGQIERLNGTLWKTIQLALRARNLPIDKWEHVLPLALHSIRSLLCTSINETPHERLFNYSRRSANGNSVPSWLVPGPILCRKNVRNKNDPYVEEVELLQSNPYYSFIRHSDGRESTVSNRKLAPLPDEENIIDSETSTSPVLTDKSTSEQSNLEPVSESQQENSVEIEVAVPRRSERSRKPPRHLNDYVT